MDESESVWYWDLSSLAVWPRQTPSHDLISHQYMQQLEGAVSLAICGIISVSFCLLAEHKASTQVTFYLPFPADGDFHGVGARVGLQYRPAVAPDGTHEQLGDLQESGGRQFAVCGLQTIGERKTTRKSPFFRHWPGSSRPHRFQPTLVTKRQSGGESQVVFPQRLKPPLSTATSNDRLPRLKALTQTLQ